MAMDEGVALWGEGKYGLAEEKKRGPRPAKKKSQFLEKKRGDQCLYVYTEEKRSSNLYVTSGKGGESLRVQKRDATGNDLGLGRRGGSM